jgi:hypothetical protein
VIKLQAGVATLSKPTGGRNAKEQRSLNGPSFCLRDRERWEKQWHFGRPRVQAGKVQRGTKKKQKWKVDCDIGGGTDKPMTGTQGKVWRGMNGTWGRGRMP